MAERAFNSRDACDTADVADRRLTGQICGGRSISGWLSARQTVASANRYVRSLPVTVDSNPIETGGEKGIIRKWLNAFEDLGKLNPYGTKYGGRF